MISPVRVTLLAAFSAACFGAAAQSPGPNLRSQLAKALATEDLPQVRRVVAEWRTQLGGKAGDPEVPDQFVPIRDTAQLDRKEARDAFLRYNDEAARDPWWKPGLDPTHLAHALREPAGLAVGAVNAAAAGLNGSERSLALARQAGDFLLWAQQQAGNGVFPFPAVRGATHDNAFVAAQRYLDRAGELGILERVVHNGWIVDDMDDGGLQFDNGVAGVAMIGLYRSTHEKKYLEAARHSADWAVSQKMVPNWNYNSFSVYLLASFYAETREPQYLAVARKKALIGVIPGQMTDGARIGRWLDPHNARPAYHYIMMRALATLAAVLPMDDSDRATVVRSIRLGLNARNPDFLDRGAPNKDSAMDSLVAVHRAFASDPAFLRETRTDRALARLGQLVSAEFREGHLSLGPGPWGIYLKLIIDAGKAPGE